MVSIYDSDFIRLDRAYADATFLARSTRRLGSVSDMGVWKRRSGRARTLYHGAWRRLLGYAGLNTIVFQGYLWDWIQQDAADCVWVADADFVVGDADERPWRLL